MTTYTISIDRNGSDAALHRMVLAGLSNSFRLVDGDADVALVSAADPGGVDRAAANATRALVVDRPGWLLPDQLEGIADAASQNGCVVVPALRYAPRLAAEDDLLGDTAVEILESTIASSGSLRAALVEQLAMIRTVLGAVASIRVLHASASNYACEATVAGQPQSRLILNGVASPTGVEEATLHAMGRERRLVVRIDTSPVARPAEVRLFDCGGVRSPWPLHQHSHRLTLVQLHRVLTTGEGDITYSLDDLRHDVRLADALP